MTAPVLLYDNVVKRVVWFANVLLATTLAACAATGDDASSGTADLSAAAGTSNIPLFAETSVLNARIEAPLQDLFDRIPKPVADAYAPGGFDVPDVSKLSVTGKVVYDDAHGHKELPGTITLRGNTSLVELAFPYLPQTTTPVQVYSDAALTKQIGPLAGTEDDGLGGAYGCGSPLSVIARSPDGKAVHVSFVYDDFHGVPDGWIAIEDVIGGNGTIPAEVNRCFEPGQD